ncbi:hypothetical protein RHGRI_018218 [Rhododendron griersonianum]|nr:hypothetical protein RHGRI_018218 [Rhododendron griersonianum]
MEMSRVREIRRERREANQCADSLAKKSFDLCNQVYVSLVEPPMFLLQQLAKFVGVKYPKTIYV